MKSYASLIVISLACVAGLVLLISKFIDTEPSKNRFHDVAPNPNSDPIADMSSMFSGNLPGSQGNTGLVPSPSNPGPDEVTVSRERNTLDGALVADHFHAALVIQPRQVLSSPFIQQLISQLGDSPLDQFQQVLGVGPDSIESVVLLVNSIPDSPSAGRTDPALGRPGADPNEPSENSDEGSIDPVLTEPSEAGAEEAAPEPIELALIIQLAEGHAAADLAQAITKAIPGIWKEETLEGKPCLVSPLPLPPPIPTALCIFNDRTILLSSQQNIQLMLTAQGNNPLAERLATVDLSNDLILVATPEILPEAALASVEQLPFPGMFKNKISELPEKIVTASIAIRLSSDPQLHVELAAADEGSARAISNDIQLILGLTTTLVKAQKDQFTNNPAAPPGLLEGLNLIDGLLSSIKHGQQGEVTTVTISLSQEMIKSLADQVLSLFGAMGEEVVPFEEGSPDDSPQ